MLQNSVTAEPAVRRLVRSGYFSGSGWWLSTARGTGGLSISAQAADCRSPRSMLATAFTNLSRPAGAHECSSRPFSRPIPGQGGHHAGSRGCRALHMLSPGSCPPQYEGRRVSGDSQADITGRRGPSAEQRFCAGSEPRHCVGRATPHWTTKFSRRPSVWSPPTARTVVRGSCDELWRSAVAARYAGGCATAR